MSNLRAFAFSVFALAACGKSDSTPAAATGTADETATTDESAPSPARSGSRRSGKIDLPRSRPQPSAPSLPGEPDEAAEDRPRRNGGAWRDQDPAKREEMKERFSEMKKEREAKLDTDKDGKISDAERVTARHERADKMRTRMDANGDGKVSADELTAERGGGRFARRLGDPATIDTNKDGDISTDELDAALGTRGKRRDRGSAGSAEPE